MKTTECTECGNILVWGEDDTGPDPDWPVCEECQEESEV